ncbi:MAG TPA: PKD domain-containing protein [Gammaproteobacteria bacterium]|nr:PKD domain-containing protein [Gammaproteobacteria bacterium]
MDKLPRKWVFLLFGVGALALGAAHAATPSSGTLTASSGPLTYTAGPFSIANPTPVPLVDSGPECTNPVQPCDNYTLTVALPDDYTSTHPGELIRVTMSWQDAGTGNSDYDLYVYPGEVATTSGAEQAQTQAASQADPEVTTLRAFNGTRTFTVKVVPYTPTGETVSVKVELIAGPVSGGGDSTAFGQATPTAPGVPRYQILAPGEHSSANGSSGEFNIGFNPKTGNIMTNSDGPVFRVTLPENRNPPLPAAGPAIWTDVSPSIASITTLDPILITDQRTGRTFVSNLTAGANVLFAYSDDDGASWIQASVSPPNGGADHQTIGAGPYPDLVPVPNPLYPNAVYYCSQTVVGPAFCQRSDDGGVSFGPGVPIYLGNGVTACSSLHGHVKVGPDGAVYVPTAFCGEHQGGTVSLDAGTTWTNFVIPGSEAFEGGSTDPSLAIGDANTVYYCYVNGQGPEHHVHVAVSHDHGQTWVNDTDIGKAVGVIMGDFPEAVAGSPGRAACGFLGSNVAGNHESLDYPGNWYLYIATTYDGGKTWTTVNATPNDPVQGHGGIWNSGGGNMNRNLLDFNEVTIDDHGYVLFGYDDGCVTDTCIQSGGEQNDFVAYQRIARQTGGKPLLAQFDADEPAAPDAPYLEGKRTAAKADLSWNAPDNGGADITAYQIYRGTSAGSETQIATVSGDKTQYADATVDASVPSYVYKIVAVNAEGSGPASNEVALQVTTTAAAEPCEPPGPTILVDAAGDSLTGTAGTDMKSLQLSQPYSADGIARLRFQINTDPGQTLQLPGSYWYVSFKTPDGTIRGVRMVYPALSTAPTTPQFESYTAAPNSSGTVDGRFVQDGSQKPADASSFYDAANGVIVIVVPVGNLGLQTGDAIGGFNAAVIQSVSSPAGGVGETVDAMPDGLAYQGSFTVSDNGQCAPNSTPLAVLKAEPTEGSAPLEVNFDASGSSDPDAGDTVVSYTFDFGDGTPTITQSTPAASHTYQDAGEYRPKLTVSDSRGLKSKNAAFVGIELTAAFEDDDAHIAYDNGWHTVNDADATGGHFHLLGGGQHGMDLTFELGSSEGEIDYTYATSTKGGSADVYIDGQFVRTVSYQGGSGSMHQPAFGASTEFDVSGQGSHTIELRNVQGAAYVDQFRIAGGSSDAQPTTAPGKTTTHSSLVVGGLQIAMPFTAPANVAGVAVTAESAGNAPFKLLVLDPNGNILDTVESAPDGTANFIAPAAIPGVYVVQLINLSLTPANVWMAATPTVQR